MDIDNLDSTQVDTETEFKIPETSSGRHRTFPRRFKDHLPFTSVQLPHMPPRLPLPLPVPMLPPPPHNPTPEPIELTFIDTEPNEFGLYRSYPHLPSFEPDKDVSLDSLCEVLHLL